MKLFSSSAPNPQDLTKRLISAIVDYKQDKFDQILATPGLDVNAAGKNDYPIVFAVLNNRAEMFGRLIEAGADIHVISKRHDMSLLTLAAYNQSFEIAKILIENKADLHLTDRQGKTALHHAARNGYGDIVRLLLNAGADPNLVDHRMATPADEADAYYARVADYIRQYPAYRKPLAALDNSWQLNGTDEIIHSSEKKGCGFTVTEIFNFTKRSYISIVFNAEAKTQSHLSKSFAELADTALVEEAAAQMKLHGIDVETRNWMRFSGKPAMLPAKGADTGIG